MCEVFIEKILQLGEKQQLSDLKELIKTSTTNVINDAIKSQVHQTNGVNFWTYLLRGFSLLDNQECQEKRFKCVQVFLNELNLIELPYKLTYDLITRLCADLTTFTNNQLVEIIEYCEDCLKVGDPKCVGWKDLLPDTLLVLTNQTNIIVNCVKMTGSEYRSKIITNLCTMKWPIKTLTPIANMFVDLKLSHDEILLVLSKFSKNMIQLAPLELPALAFQLFTLCQNSAQIIVPIVAFEKFFHRYYYKKLFADMESNTTDFNSIDEYTDKELREAEETIFYHLSFCTRFKISEHQMCITLKNLASSSEIILTPFVLSAILSMTQGNREPDSCILSSPLLQFLKNVIKHNEDEKELSEYSVWCRDTLQNRYKDLEQIFTVLIDQNKDGKDVVTPGLVNLSFVLLRAKNLPKLNALGANFLQKFIKKRFVFGHGVVKNLADWMIVEQEALQYSECLTALGMSDTFTVSECVKTIKYVLDFFLWIPGNHAMRMMSFVLPVLKISHTIRDYLIEVLQKAINSRDLATCRMGVYGFCMLLKQLNNNNSQRTSITSGNMLTQNSISGFSMMSQATMGNRENPQRHFDMLTLEIIGCLRRCFTCQLEVKETLYESLNRAVELNPKLAPHILEFIDYHFRAYFEIDENQCEIYFDKVVKNIADNVNDIQVLDNIGKLTMFVGFTTIVCDKNQFVYDTTVLKTVIKTLIIRICSKELELIEMTGMLDLKKSQIALQTLNLLEALMAYALWTAKPTNDNIKKIEQLFMEHQRIRDGLKTLNLSSNKKGSKKAKPTNNTTIENETMNLNGIIVKKINTKSINIWDLPTIERFLRLILDEVVTFSSSSATAPVRSNRPLVRYILEITAAHIEQMRNEPDYKQVTHSRRMLKNLTEVTRVIYERCIKKLNNFKNNFDEYSAYLATDCLWQSLTTAQQVYKKKIEIYLRGVDLMSTTQGNERMAYIIQRMLDKLLEDVDEIETTSEAKKIPGILMQCLDVLYDFMSNDDPITLDSYNWLFKFCQTYELHNKETGHVFKLLFGQRLKTHFGVFFDSIAINLEKVFGKVDKEIESNANFELKSITESTAELCFNHLLNTIRKQIEDIEYFIQKVKSSLFKIKIAANDDHEMSNQSLRTMERSICTQLVHLSNVLLHLTNVSAPLGNCMDNLIRNIIQFYVCLTNLTKHFIIRNTIISVSYKGIKFDQVLRLAGKPLANRVYALISHVDTQILATNQTKKNNPSADRAKILRDTKLLPKIVLNVENFNKFVILLSKKTKSHFSHFLHIGTVRDFRIKTCELKEAINETLQHTSQIDAEETMLDNISDELDEVTDSGELPIIPVAILSQNSNTSDENVLTRDSEDVLIEESSEPTSSRFLKNAAKVSRKIRKRKKMEESEDSVIPMTSEEQPQRKLRRSNQKK